MINCYALKDLSKMDNDTLNLLNKNFYDCLKEELTQEQLKLNFPNDFKKIFNELINLKPVFTPEEKEKK